ncbi:hypothetical protein BZL29_6488 [Mycobacterium kansasii]|uniref:Uncharacterized protein n=1 Tax=Mycobacterium kansasii TaxID=1768 RepID=A0A1V3WRM2_MYCKA|nr:hypothetical protein BZL29_6488 [Mycobacterium kansasii]
MALMTRADDDAVRSNEVGYRPLAGRVALMTRADDDAVRSNEVGVPPACGGEWR